MHRTLAAMIPLSVLALTACGSGDALDNGVQQRVQLQPFDSCQALESYIQQTAVRQMELRLEARMEDEITWSSNQGRVMDGGVAMPAADAGAGPPSTESPSGPAAHTTTNTQVKDVDEPDFVKNDGTRILVLSNNTLWVASSWPPSKMHLTGSAGIEGRALQMFLRKDQVVVFSAVTGKQVGGNQGGCMGSYHCSSHGSATKVTVLDISDLSKPRVVEAHYLPGRFKGARRVGSAVRIVLADSFRWPAGVRWYPEYDGSDYMPWYGGSGRSESEIRAAYARLKASNRKEIKSQRLGAWLPHGQRQLPGGKTIDVGYECSDFYRANAPVRLGVASVVSLDLDKLEQPPSRTSVIGEVREIYASKSSLYLTSSHWWWRASGTNDSHIYIHKFDTTDARRAKYVASGGVAGRMLDQFSMDEHKGFFRIATTISTPIEDPVNQWQTSTTVNRVSVLAEKAGQLRVVGRTPDLARGERIYSVRFQGDRGYVVTFRQVDPLYTLDLSRPTDPRVVGELKVPGFSTYIHPVGDDHLLTIGIYQPADGNFGERRVRLTMFDVSNFAKPSEKFTHLIGTVRGSSAATYEHKAFNYFAQRGLLAIPFADYLHSSAGSYWDHFVSEARVYKIDVDKGITPIGSLSMGDVFENKGSHSWGSYFSPWVKRSVMATDTAGTDYVYAISDAGLRVAAIGALDVPLATVRF